MSPEQLASEPYSYPADLWALGCVLFELLTLEKAFAEDSYPGLVKAVALEWRHEGGEGARAGEHALFLAASAARDADLTPALLLLPTFGALLHGDPAARTTLADLAEALRPHVPPPCEALLEPLVDASPAEEAESRLAGGGSSPRSELRRRRAGARCGGPGADDDASPVSSEITWPSEECAGSSSTVSAGGSGSGTEVQESCQFHMLMSCHS
mmetsp:Transcript_2706/g.8007  ORF Transcript_2706/g.8007 Transcript_2706/m.8007 type:complete len:212 (+) Transcript_2706:1024-1659(+)